MIAIRDEHESVLLFASTFKHQVSRKKKKIAVNVSSEEKL